MIVKPNLSECFECKLKYESEIQSIHSKVSEMHKILMGNGRPGLWEEFNQLKGGLTLARILAFSSAGLSVLAVAAQFI